MQNEIWKCRLTCKSLKKGIIAYINIFNLKIKKDNKKRDKLKLKVNLNENENKKSTKKSINNETKFN